MEIIETAKLFGCFLQSLQTLQGLQNLQKAMLCSLLLSVFAHSHGNKTADKYK